MALDELTPQTTGDETIGENGTVTDDPNPDENNTGADKSQDTTFKDPTSINEGGGAGEEQNYLGTFKTREDAENGFKSAQAKITEQGNKIKELEAQINKADAPQLPDVNKEIATVQQKVNAEYTERLQGLGVKYSSYLPDDIEVNTIDDIVANLPPTAAARFTAEFKDIQAEYNNKLKEGVDGVYKTANEKFEEIKAADKEKFKDNDVVFNAWYNPPKTIDEVAELVETVKKRAIEEYIKEQAANTEDKDHKNRLSGVGGNSKNKYGEGHIFTRQEINDMSQAEFSKNERIISEQVAKGLVQ